MMDLRECLYRCDQLLRSLEEDRAEIAESLDGDLLEAYRRYVDREIEAVRKLRRTIANTMAGM